MSIARRRSGLLRLALAGATLGAGMAAAPASTATPANSATPTGVTIPSSAAATPTTATPTTAGWPVASTPAGEDCTVSDLLVNPCRLWLGAVVDYYPARRRGATRSSHTSCESADRSTSCTNTTGRTR